MYSFFNIAVHLCCVGLIIYSFFIKTSYGSLIKTAYKSHWKNILRGLAIALLMIWAILVGVVVNITNLIKLL